MEVDTYFIDASTIPRSESSSAHIWFAQLWEKGSKGEIPVGFREGRDVRERRCLSGVTGTCEIYVLTYQQEPAVPRLCLQYAKNLSPVGLPHTRIHMLEMITQTDMYTSTGHRARDFVASVHVAHTSVDAIANAVMPDG